jgi:hypothetical protein
LRRGGQECEKEKEVLGSAGKLRKVGEQSFVIKNMKRSWRLGGAALSAGLLAVGMASWAGNPVEVGTVKWGRDYDAALAAAKESGKPVLVLFQEVPG